MRNGYYLDFIIQLHVDVFFESSGLLCCVDIYNIIRRVLKNIYFFKLF